MQNKKFEANANQFFYFFNKHFLAFDYSKGFFAYSVTNCFHLLQGKSYVEFNVSNFSL